MNQVNTHIDELPVTISDEGSGPFGVSVFYSAYKYQQFDNVESNRRLFGLLMHVSVPNITEDEIESRWQDVLNDSIHTVKWDDGCEFWPSPSSTGDSPGSFDYIEINL